LASENIQCQICYRARAMNALQDPCDKNLHFKSSLTKCSSESQTNQTSSTKSGSGFFPSLSIMLCGHFKKTNFKSPC